MPNAHTSVHTDYKTFVVNVEYVCVYVDCENMCVCSLHASYRLMPHCWPQISFSAVFFDPAGPLWHLPSPPLIPYAGGESGETHAEERKQSLFSITGPLMMLPLNRWLRRERPQG